MKHLVLFIFIFLAGSAALHAQSITSDKTGENGIRKIEVTPDDVVCSIKIEIELKGDEIQSVVYTRGCNGNAKGIGALIKGMKIDEAIDRLDGITCGKRTTSCPDQLAKALKAIRDKEARQ